MSATGRSASMAEAASRMASRLAWTCSGRRARWKVTGENLSAGRSFEGWSGGPGWNAVPVAFEDLAHLRRARDLMDREYARPLDVPAMARAALMSPAHFSRRFRAEYGETPYNYLMTRRIERAMALL